MSFRKTLVHRLLQIPKPVPARSRCHVARSPAPSLLQRLHGAAAAAASGSRPEALAFPSMIDRLRAMSGERIRLDAVAPPVPVPVPPDRAITVEEARKVLRVSQMEIVRERLRGTPGSSITYERFVEICGEACGGGESGKRIASALDESGTVLVLGNVVFHRPEQVAHAIASVIPLPSTSPTTTTTKFPDMDETRHSELRSLEQRKAAIDAKAEARVRRELWCGLAFLLAQTVGFMRLTFWELSWDVMEPICFYVGSVYFMAGYAFFLRTAKDPSFEGFFNSRFAAHQRRLMAAEGFDLRRLHELRRALGRTAPITRVAPCLELQSCPSSPSGFYSHYGGCGCRDRVVGVVH